MVVDKSVYQKPFWMLPLAQVLSDLATSNHGLTEEEAKQRLATFGPNTIHVKKPIRKLAIFGRQFKNPLIVILLVAGGITISLNDFHDAGFILLAAFINACLGYYQEHKAEAALEHLKSYITSRVRVMRGGAEREVDTSELVPGDIIHVTQGDRVPADARIVHGDDLRVDQAILTGESLPVEKSAREAGAHAAIADQHCMLFGGTLVAQGFGTAVVTATDEYTQFGKIASLVMREQAERTPLQRALTRFTLRSASVVFLLTIGLFFIAKNSGIDTLQAFLIAVATLVAAVPEGLPIVTTVILAIGVQRLAKQKGVVRRLTAAETLGSTTVILTDKTGTLTQAKMTLSSIRVFEKEPELKDGLEKQEEFLIHTALLNIDAVVENPSEKFESWRLIGKPLEVALIKAAANRGIHFPSLRKDKQALHFLPFNSNNKFSASVYKMTQGWFSGRFKHPEPYVLSLAGAPEILLGLCDMPAAEREMIAAEVATMANSGERVIGVATKEVENLDGFHLRDHTHMHGLRFIGTIAFRDPLRPGVRQALHHVERAGLRVIMVTGDHEGTAVSVARELGMDITPGSILHGQELETMSLELLRDHLPNIKIVSRVSPAGKLKILRALREAGEVVAMTGDGINDAPALREADIGVAMGSGTDVSQDVADLVLLDDNFETIVAAIGEGRRIVSNIRKAIVYLSSTLLSEIFLIGGALIAGVATPLNALQILWINFFTDSFPGIALAFEEQVDRARGVPQRPSQNFFTGEMRFMIGVNGIISSLLLLGLYLWLLHRGYDPAVVKTVTFAALSTYSLFMVVAVRNLKSAVFAYNPFSNKMINYSILFGSALTLAAIYLPPLQKYFGTVPLTGLWLLVVVGFGLFNVLLIELTKAIFAKERV